MPLLQSGWRGNQLLLHTQKVKKAAKKRRSTTKHSRLKYRHFFFIWFFDVFAQKAIETDLKSFLFGYEMNLKITVECAPSPIRVDLIESSFLRTESANKSGPKTSQREEKFCKKNHFTNYKKLFFLINHLAFLLY